MLGEQQQAARLEGRGDALMHGAQPRDRGEQAERAAARRDEQRRISRRDLPDVVARDVGNHEDPGLRRIVERRGDARGGRARRQMPQTGAGLGAAPGQLRIGRAVGQGRRGDDEAVRRLRDQRGKRDAGIDPVAVDRDIALQPVDPVEREPLDRIGSGRFAEIAQQPAPGGELQFGAPVEAADRRVETLPQTGLGRVVGILEPGSQRFGQLLQSAAASRSRLSASDSAASTSPSIGGRASACRP